MTNLHTKNSVWLRSVFLAVSILCCLGTTQIAIGQVPKVQAVFPKADIEIPITQWQFLGPFRFEAKDIAASDATKLPVGLNRDYLAEFGETEESIEPTKFPLLRTVKPGFVLAEDFRNEPVSTAPISNVLDLATAYRPVDYAIAYVGVVIESPRDQDILISGGVDDSMKVWLNHELLFADQNTRSHFIKRFGQLGGGKLTKGSNFLLVKTCNLTGDWRLWPNGSKSSCGYFLSTRLISKCLKQSQSLRNGKC
jgi:hypothetical protein